MLKESCQNVTIADHMESGVEGLVASRVIIANDMKVAVAQTLASA